MQTQSWWQRTWYQPSSQYSTRKIDCQCEMRIHASPDSLDAPNWLPTGSTVKFDDEGCIGEETFIRPGTWEH